MLLSKKRDESGFAKTFPQQLMELLSNFDDVRESITWMPKGDAFIILSESSLEEKVLPRFFKKSKFSSFKGKLYRWGFKRVMKGENAGGYFHKLFVRDDPILCLHMRRSVKKGGCGDMQMIADEIVCPLKSKRNRMHSDTSNLRPSNCHQATTQAAHEVERRPKTEQITVPTIPKLPNPISFLSEDSQVTYSNDGAYYNHTLLLTQLARELLYKKIALRSTQIQETYFDSSVGNMSRKQNTSYTPRSSSGIFSENAPKFGIVLPSKKNILLSTRLVTRNQSSPLGDKKISIRFSRSVKFAK